MSKFGDHLPLYRQERIYARAGLAIPQSTLGAWVGLCGVHLQPLVDALQQEVLTQSVVHADETPVQMLSPGNGKAHRAYLWAYAPSQFSSLRVVVYQFAPSRSWEHARAFLQNWQGKLVCDDFSGKRPATAAASSMPWASYRPPITVGIERSTQGILEISVRQPHRARRSTEAP